MAHVQQKQQDVSQEEEHGVPGGQAGDPLEQPGVVHGKRPVLPDVDHDLPGQDQRREAGDPRDPQEDEPGEEPVGELRVGGLQAQPLRGDDGGIQDQGAQAGHGQDALEPPGEFDLVHNGMPPFALAGSNIAPGGGYVNKNLS